MKKALIITLVSAFSLNIAASAQESYKPQVYGLVKARYEVALQSGDMRFSLRNTRLGVKGMATSFMRYNVQMELNSLGNFSVLDTYIGLVYKGFELTLGQQPMWLSTELTRGAGGYFANRSFVGKFLTQYYSPAVAPGNNGVFDLGARDIGAILQYKGDWKIPVTFNFGVLNGAGINDASWNRDVNLLGRVDIGGNEGVRFAAGYMGGKNRLNNRMDMWDVELRYSKGRIIAESEFAKRYLDLGGGTDVLTVAVVNVMYSFPLKKNPVAKAITPQLRWDFADNVKFMNMDGTLDGFDAQRLTAGVRIGLTDRVLESELRINYEYHFLGHRPSDYRDNPLLQDKFTIEFFARF